MAKVIFLQLSVIHSVHRGGTWSGPGGCTWSGPGVGWGVPGLVPEGGCTWSGPGGVSARYTPGTRYTPLDQVHPLGPSTPPGPGTSPQTRYTPPRTRYTPPNMANKWPVHILLECILVRIQIPQKLSCKPSFVFFFDLLVGFQQSKSFWRIIIINLLIYFKTGITLF